MSSSPTLPIRFDNVSSQQAGPPPRLAVLWPQPMRLGFRTGASPDPLDQAAPPGLRLQYLVNDQRVPSAGAIAPAPASALSAGAYLDQAHAELVGPFLDHGYLVGLKPVDGVLKPNPDGESTLCTALAVVALAVGNYHQDAWETANANDRIADLLTTLKDRSWGNNDGLGRIHPIRHPDVKDFDEAGNVIRNSPLSKDSFGAIVAAAYYAYSCPHSNDQVRGLARELMRKWTDYLVLNQWRTHSNFISGEFETVHKKELDPATGAWKDTDNNDQVYKNIFSALVGSEPKEARQVDYKGPETYMLWPHELYALQNAAAMVGIPTSAWDIWSNELPAELEQMVSDYAAPYLADAAGRGLDYILQRLGFAIPYNIPLGPPEWNLGKVQGVFEVKIPASDRERTVAAFRDIVRDVIKEAVRLNNFRTNQAGDLVGLAVDKVLDILPDSLGRDKWRSILIGGVQQIVPWLSKAGWVEAATFVATLAYLQLKGKPDVINYTFSVLAVECESRPEMEDILKTFVQSFYGSLRDHGNPNGLWAWLAEDTGRLHDQMNDFVANDPRQWSTFAFDASDAFNAWHDKAPTADQFARLDYLLIQALDEKGPPKGVSDVVSHWWQDFVDAVTSASQSFIAAIKAQFQQLGRYTRDAVDAAGRLIRETWTSALEYSQEQWESGQLKLRQVWDKAGALLQRLGLQADGKWIEEYWNRTTEKYWRGLWDKVGGSQLEQFRELVDGRWEEVYFAGKDGFKFWRGLWDKRSGGQMLEWFRTLGSDQWEEIYLLGRGAEKYWRGLWDKQTGGKMLEQFRKLTDDKWEEVYLLGRGAEKYWRGLWDHAGAGSTMLEQFRKLTDDKWEEVYLTGKDGFKYWRGLWDKQADGKMLEWFRKLSNDQWEEMYLAGRGAEKYWRGLWDKQAGGKLLEQFRTLNNDQWEEVYLLGRGAEKYWRGLWDKNGAGSKMLEQFRTLMDDKWEEIYWTGRDAFKYWRGLWDKQTAGQMLEWFRTLSNDQWEEMYFAGRDGAKYWRGLWNQRASGAEMLERFEELSDSKWMEEYWDKADPYWRGIWDKRGSAGKMIERYTKSVTNVVVEVWNASNQYGKSVFDQAGHLLSSSGISTPIHLPDWWPPKINVPW